MQLVQERGREQVQALESDVEVVEDTQVVA